MLAWVVRAEPCCPRFDFQEGQPSRPFLEPVFQKYGANPDEVSRRFLERVAKNLGGDLGR